MSSVELSNSTRFSKILSCLSADSLLCSPHSAFIYASPNGSVATATVGHVCRTCSAYLPLSFPINASMLLRFFQPFLTVFSHIVSFYLSILFSALRSRLPVPMPTKFVSVNKAGELKVVFSFSSTHLKLGMQV